MCSFSFLKRDFTDLTQKPWIPKWKSITDKIHSVVSLTVLSFPYIRFNKLKFSRKIESLKFHSFNVYFLLTSFIVFKIPQMAFNYNKSKCICHKEYFKDMFSVVQNLIDIFHKSDSCMYNKIYYMIFISSVCMCETFY